MPAGRALWTARAGARWSRLAGVMVRPSTRKRQRLRRLPGRRRGGATGSTPHVPGYRLGPPLGFGARGAVWSATAVAGAAVTTGRACAVSVLPDGPEGSRAGRNARWSTLLEVRHECLAEVLDVVALRESCAIVSERIDGPTLAVVRASRAALEMGEVAAVVSGVGDALAHLHDRGVTHGDVSPANVVLADPGRPVLVDLAGDVEAESGTAGFLPPERERGDPASPAGDVWSLAVMAAWLVSAADRPDLERRLEPALAADPGDRCTAAELSTLARSLGEPRDVRLPAPASMAQGSLRARAVVDETRLASRRRSRRRRRQAVRRPSALAWVFALAVGLVVGAGAGLAGSLRAPELTTTGGASPTLAAASGGTARGGLTPESASEEGQDGLVAAVTWLIGQRDVALNTGDAGALAALTVPDSRAAGGDASLAASLAARGAWISGLVTQVERVTVLEVAGGSARVEVVTRQGSHIRRDGPTSRQVPEQPTRCAVLILERPTANAERARDAPSAAAALSAQWRLRDVEACESDVS